MVVVVTIAGAAAAAARAWHCSHCRCAVSPRTGRWRTALKADGCGQNAAAIAALARCQAQRARQTELPGRDARGWPRRWKAFGRKGSLGLRRRQWRRVRRCPQAGPRRAGYAGVHSEWATRSWKAGRCGRAVARVRGARADALGAARRRIRDLGAERVSERLPPSPQSPCAGTYRTAFELSADLPGPEARCHDQGGPLAVRPSARAGRAVSRGGATAVAQRLLCSRATRRG